MFKHTTTLELDTGNAKDFNISETRKGFLDLLKILNIPMYNIGINFKIDENGMIEISTNNGYKFFKNTYMREIKEKMTKEKLYKFIRNYKDSCVIMEYEKISFKLLQPSTKLKTEYFNIQARYAWKDPDFLAQKKEYSRWFTNFIHEMLIEYITDRIKDFPSICYSTTEELPDGYEEFMDDEDWFMGIQKENVFYEWPEYEEFAPNPYPAGTVTKNNDGQYPPCLLYHWSKEGLKNIDLDDYDLGKETMFGYKAEPIDEDVKNEIIRMRTYGSNAYLRDFYDGIRDIWYGYWRNDIHKRVYDVPKNKTEATETKEITKWTDHSSEDDTDFSPEDELHFDEYGEIVDVKYTQNELRRLREEPWYDESNKYYYMKTPTGQKFKEGSPYYLLGQLWSEHIKTKAIRRAKAKKNTPKNPPNAPKKTWNTISHKSRNDLSPIHFPSL